MFWDYTGGTPSSAIMLIAGVMIKSISEQIIYMCVCVCVCIYIYIYIYSIYKHIHNTRICYIYYITMLYTLDKEYSLSGGSKVREYEMFKETKDV